MLGSSITKALLKQRGAIVYAASSHSGQDCENDACGSSMRFVSNNRAMELLDEGEVNLLVHCAFPRDNDGCSLAKGLEFTSGLFAAARNNCSIINISSQSVYSQTKDRPALECDSVCPQSPYGVAKYASELMLGSLRGGLQFTSIRLASLLAPGFDARFVNKMIRAGHSSGRIRIAGPNNIFGFMSVEDAADAICSMVPTVNESAWKPVYNLGPSAKGLSLRQIGNEIQLELIHNGRPCTLDDCITGVHEVNSSLDSGLFCKDFKWQSKSNLRQIIAEIIHDFDQRGE